MDEEFKKAMGDILAKIEKMSKVIERTDFVQIQEITPEERGRLLKLRKLYSKIDNEPTIGENLSLIA